MERIVKWAARMNSSKAPGPVGRAVRDALMPAFMKLAAAGKAHRQAHDYRVDWNAAA